MFGHQADDGLIGIEVEALVRQHGEGSNDDERDRREAAPQQLPCDSVVPVPLAWARLVHQDG